MLDLDNLFFTRQFIPHGHCYLWKPGLVWLHITSDALIALAYYSIPLMLVYFVRKRQDVPFDWIFLMFGAFIVACGTSHVMEIWTLWHPTYWLSGFLKAITAFVSVCTAVELLPLIPQALALPSPAQLEVANMALKNEITERQRAEEALRESETQNQALLNAIPDLMIRMTKDGTYLDFRPAKNFASIMPTADMRGQNLHDVMPPEISQQRLYYTEQALQTGKTQVYEHQLQMDGHTTYEEARIVVSGADEVLVIVRDITYRKQAEEALQQAKEKYRNIFENAIEGIFQTVASGHFISANPSLAHIYGYESPEELITHLTAPAQQLYVEPKGRAEFIRLLQEHTTVKKFESQVYRKDGKIIWISENARTVLDANGALLYYEGFVEDITERKLAEEQLLRNAFYDVLTDLPNRALFMERLERAINRAKRYKDYLFAVVFVDLDRFKNINDSLGHLIGDQLLIAVAKKLEASIRTTDTVARLGGDEFAILLEDIKGVSEAIFVAERIKKELTSPMNLDRHEIFTTASIGIATSSTSYKQPEELLRDADLAMYRAKASGKACYEIFTPKMHSYAVALLQLETDLRRAIDRQQFLLHYQPIVSLQTEQIIGFEALIRWQHPERGLVFPGEFIPLAEETGLICLISWWVLHEACRQLRIWQTQLPTTEPLTISVNLSTKQFYQPDLVKRITQILQETGLDASNLKLEITESAIMDNVEFASAKLWQLRELGIQLHMDDFGTGYSSLSYLLRFPLDALKIDRSFISQMADGGESLEIVRTIIMLAQNLGINAIAEGVETTEQLTQLKSLQCKYAQGYLFSRPVDAETALALIRDW